MDWTPEVAIETDAKVRVELRTSRASLIRFVAEGAWRLLPGNYATAAAYVQDAAGVKRSEAYRLVATSRAAQMILGRFIQSDDVVIDIKAYRWMVNDVIKSSHVGEYLCSIIGELTSDIEERVGELGDVYEAIAASVAAHQKPSAPSPVPDRSEVPPKQPSPPEGETEPFTGDYDAPVSDPKSVERGERLIICPHCHMALK